MDNLKNLTKSEHRNAERTTFMRRLIKKNITPEQYYVYLKNQLAVYTTLEFYASRKNIFEGEMSKLERSPALLEDLLEMESAANFNSLGDNLILSTAINYIKYIEEIQNNKDRLFAHIYVRHMGDLSGGQMIKKLVPGPTSFYEFDSDTEYLKSKIREKLHDGLVDEAKVCFGMVQDFLEELEQYFNGTDSEVMAKTK